MLIYMQIYAYIGAFWIAFGLILYHCSPRRGESPTTPRELCKTVKCKRNIGRTLQNLVSESHLEVKDNRGCRRRECKEATKVKSWCNYARKSLLSFLMIFILILAQMDINQVRISSLKFLYVILYAASNMPTATRFKWQANAKQDVACDLS